jgi:hypothetical protein
MRRPPRQLPLVALPDDVPSSNVVDARRAAANGFMGQGLVPDGGHRRPSGVAAPPTPPLEGKERAQRSEVPTDHRARIHAAIADFYRRQRGQKK